MPERIAPVGYINDEHKHAIISIYEPALLNASHKDNKVQVVISIDGAIKLREELDKFIARHGAI